MGLLEYMKSHKIVTLIVALIAIVVAFATTVITVDKVSPVSFGWFGQVHTVDGLAMQGYDPVAYHIEGAAKKGSASHAFTWQGAEWHFASAENKTAFQQNPGKYAPAYGGYCAFAVSKGFTAKSNPESWRINDGRLYLLNGPDVVKSWDEEITQGAIPTADNNWSKRQ